MPTEDTKHIAESDSTQIREGNGYPDCIRCFGEGVIPSSKLDRSYPTEECPQCGGRGRGLYDHTITDDVRLGAVLAGLTLASRLIRDTVKQANPPTRMRQPLDGDEHDGHWLTRTQVYDAVQASAVLERIWREVSIRVANLPAGQTKQFDGTVTSPGPAPSA